MYRLTEREAKAIAIATYKDVLSFIGFRHEQSRSPQGQELSKTKEGKDGIQNVKQVPNHRR